MKQAKAETDRMIGPDCATACKRSGKHRYGLQRFRCQSCGKAHTEDHERTLGGITIDPDKPVLEKAFH